MRDRSERFDILEHFVFAQKLRGIRDDLYKVMNSYNKTSIVSKRAAKTIDWIGKLKSDMEDQMFIDCYRDIAELEKIDSLYPINIYYGDKTDEVEKILFKGLK